MTEVTQTSKILTQNFVTVPRKVPEGPLNIVGLTRSSLREASRKEDLVRPTIFKGPSGTFLGTVTKFCVKIFDV